LVNLSRFETASASDLLSWAIDTFGDSFAVATSFQKEGMVILDLASRISAGVRVFTLDTGRLPDETYRMMETVRRRYGIPVEIVFPERGDVEHLVEIDGPNLFYSSVPARLRCCGARKVRPLERKLETLKAWATGLRRDQAGTRAGIPKVERGPAGRMKICPLADWSAARVEEYIARHAVPVHPLYALGYTSIGCAPCTRAVQPGESGRAGRWWWEEDAKKECGIHFAPDGSAARNIAAEAEPE
jgi:phosphoadenylyl-sulfate reductase (thioredoxin)